MFKVLIPAVAALGLVAFAAQTKGEGVDAQPQAAMGWHLSHEGEMAKLAYGVENSDQLALMMTCAPGDSSAVVYGDVQPAGPRLIQASTSGPAAIDPLSGGEAFETRIGLGDAGLKTLADKGRLRVNGDAGTFDLPATRDERRMIAGFLAYCGTDRA
jgi:hypothetical protein